jgi:anti-anti-sigma factor
MDYQDEPVTITTIPDGIRVAILGSVHGNVAWLEGELKKAASTKPKKVELDLGKMSFASSIGLAVLISFRNTIVNNGGTVTTVAIQDQILGTVKYAHLQEVLNVGPHTQILKGTH